LDSWQYNSSLIKIYQFPKSIEIKHDRVCVTTLQLADFPEIFAGGDCVAEGDKPLPPGLPISRDSDRRNLKRSPRIKNLNQCK